MHEAIAINHAVRHLSFAYAKAKLKIKNCQQ
jgi:hypothetical protein